MNYPYKYVIQVFDSGDYSEALSTFYYLDLADAEKHYNSAKKSGSKVFMFRILKSDNLDL